MVYFTRLPTSARNRPSAIDFAVTFTYVVTARLLDVWS